MLTIRAAAALLARAHTPGTARPLLRALGFEAPPQPVDLRLRAALGLDDAIERASLCAGPGALRALIATAPTDADLRDATRRIGAAVDRHAPGAAWLICLLHPSARQLSLAVVSGGSGAPRMAALRVDQERVTDSDADTLRALAAVPRDDPQLVYTRWTDILGRDALSTRFYRTLDRLVRHMADSAHGKATADERHTLALLSSSRLLFLAFLEAKGWLDRDRGFLMRECTAALERGGTLHNGWLRPLFFGTLNTPTNSRAAAARRFGNVPFLNGGLFAQTPLERRRHQVTFCDDAIVALIGELLDRYRFTAREDSATWTEAAVDPEMLGRAFESLMAPAERRGSGTFYTPPALVERVVSEALQVALARAPVGASPSQLHRLDSLRCLDPACGSGAFLVHTLERLTSMRIAAGDARPHTDIRRAVLASSIFGVDRSPMAVWLCELRLWLAVVIDCHETDPQRVPPLPNLDHHVRVGDSLAGGDFRFTPATGRRLEQLRHRYVQAVGTRKRSLANALDREERSRARAELTRTITMLTHERKTLLVQLRSRDLFGERVASTRAQRRQLEQVRARIRELRARERRLALGGALPFRFASHLADVGAAGGFDMVIGNPPWVRPHQLSISERVALRRDFVTMRDAAWRVGATRTSASPGFAAQADLAAAFVERSLKLLRPDGVAALLVPAKLWRSLAGGGVRRLLTESTHVQVIVDWSDAPALFDAATYPSLVVAQRTGAPTESGPRSAARGSTHPDERVRVHVMRGATDHTFVLPTVSLPLGGGSAAPWLLLPPHVRAAFERLRRSGPALGEAGLGRPTLGVKCGCNDAFLVAATEHDDHLATVVAGERTGTIERRLLRPALPGRKIAAPEPALAQAATADPSTNELRIVWTHGRDGRPLQSLPPQAARWMQRWRPRLERRRDANQRLPWWTLFRTDSARTDTPRLVWADFGRQLRTCVLDAGDPTVPLNTCYVLRTPAMEDAWALDALLSSPIASAWLDAIAEPARGGWRRFLGWTVAALPLPEDWLRARLLLAPLGRRRGAGDPPSPQEHVEVVASAYRLSVRSLQPLLDWSHDPGR